MSGGFLGFGLLPADGSLLVPGAGSIFGYAMGHGSAIAFLGLPGAILAGVAGAVTFGGLGIMVQRQTP